MAHFVSFPEDLARFGSTVPGPDLVHYGCFWRVGTGHDLANFGSFLRVNIDKIAMAQGINYNGFF